MTHCDICDYDYNEREASACYDHDRLHELFTKRCAELGYTPRDSCARNALYQKAINLIQSYDFGSRIRGSMLLIRRNYDRSLHHAVIQGYHLEHPNFEEYLSMTFDSFKPIPVEIKAHFLEEYGCRRNEIAPGYSHWYPRGSGERAEQFEEYRKYDSKLQGVYVRPLGLLAAKKRNQRKHG